MNNLADTIAGQPPMRWLIGKVYAVTGDTIVLDYNGGLTPNVGCSDQYIPTAGDVVHVLAWAPNGLLALCSNNAPLTLPTPPVPVGTPITVNANAGGTYDTSTGLWVTPWLIQSPTQVACWFYTASAFASLSTSTLASFEIEVTRTDGGPPEFVTHLNAATTGTLALTGQRYAKDQPALTVPTWVRLPLEWGQQLISGAIKGVGVGGGAYTGTYSGTGRVRLTPL